MNEYQESDKSIIAFLLTRKDVQFLGTSPLGNVLYFRFQPPELAKKLSELFYAKQVEPIQPKDYAEAQQTVTDIIWRWRKSRDGQMYDINR